MSEEVKKPLIFDHEIPPEFEYYRYATNIAVGQSEREFFITFSCIRPFEKPYAVARVIVSPEHMREIIAVMQTQYAKYLEGRGEAPGGAGGLRR